MWETSGGEAVPAGSHERGDGTGRRRRVRGDGVGCREQRPHSNRGAVDHREHARRRNRLGRAQRTVTEANKEFYRVPDGDVRASLTDVDLECMEELPVEDGGNSEELGTVARSAWQQNGATLRR